jgi:hypothetical protein
MTTIALAGKNCISPLSLPYPAVLQVVTREFNSLVPECVSFNLLSFFGFGFFVCAAQRGLVTWLVLFSTELLNGKTNFSFLHLS